MCPVQLQTHDDKIAYNTPQDTYSMSVKWKLSCLTWVFDYYLAKRALLKWIAVFTIWIVGKKMTEDSIMLIIVTQFWKTILLGTMTNFLFYSLTEAPGSYLSHVKISAWYHEAFQRYGHFTVQYNFYSTIYCQWVIKCDEWWQITLLTFFSSTIHRKSLLIVKSSILGPFQVLLFKDLVSGYLSYEQMACFVS